LRDGDIFIKDAEGLELLNRISRTHASPAGPDRGASFTLLFLLLPFLHRHEDLAQSRLPAFPW
jgi:hypothetical protein